MSNNFDTNILLDNGLGSAAAPGAYIGFGRNAGTAVSTGPRIYSLSDSPNGVLTAPRGSIALRTTIGSVQLWQNTDAGTTWQQMGSLSSGTVSLTDDQASALLFAEGANPYLRFRTSNASEAIEFAVDLDLGNRDGVDLNAHIRNGSATAFEFETGIGGAVLLGFNTNVAGEGLYSGAAQLATTAAFTWVPLDNNATALQIAATNAGPYMLTFDTRNGAELVGFGADLDFAVRNAATFANILNGNATAFEFRAGAGGTVLLGFDTNTAGEALYSAAAQLSTTAATFTWLPADNSATSLRIGLTDAGAYCMTFDTQNGQEMVIIGGANGLRLNDACELRFGSTSTVIFTPSAGDMTVSGGSDLIFASDFDVQWGTGSIVAERYNTGTTTKTETSVAVPGGGTVGFAWTSGNAGAGNSGGFTFTSGTAAGGNRGSFGLDVLNFVLTLAGNIDVTAQATTIAIRDATASAFRVAQGADGYIDVDTTNAAEAVTFGNATTNPDYVFGGIGDTTLGLVGWIRSDGIDHAARMVITEDFCNRPDVIANVGNNDANKKWLSAGTNPTAFTFDAGGGVVSTTGGGANDASIVWPQTGANQSMLATAFLQPQRAPTMKANFKVNDTANVRLMAAMKLTAVLDLVTDADQVGIIYDVALMGNANWWFTYRIGGAASVSADTGVACAAGSYRMVIAVDGARVARCYLNGVLVGTSAALTAGANLLPGIGGLNIAPGVNRVVPTVQRITVSKSYS